jgi:hypothetical protein
MLYASKSVKVFNVSHDSSGFAAAAMLNNEQLQSSVVLLGSQHTESCIQVNRNVTRELRPPFNLGDDQRSSSHHDEMCEFTMVESEV